MILLADEEGPDQTAWMPEDTFSLGTAFTLIVQFWLMKSCFDHLYNTDYCV